MREQFESKEADANCATKTPTLTTIGTAAETLTAQASRLRSMTRSEMYLNLTQRSQNIFDGGALQSHPDALPSVLELYEFSGSVLMGNE